MAASETEIMQGETTPEAKPGPKTFALSESAARQIVRLKAERGTPDAALRVAVRGGGCSGMTYAMDWADAPRERDKVFERDGAKVVIDPKSYLYLMGSELTYQEGLLASGFKIENPRVKSACGCGESFSM
ncbi:MAG TPA: iron-sulfur cluster assembly accessory protein [Myxococcaceae bacterium]|nr:iron-sulfur cluster assembly accessory protein [Myxococcaceae bacterium]